LYSVTTVTARVKSATIQLSDRDLEDIVDGVLAMASAGRRDPRIHHLGRIDTECVWWSMWQV